MAVHSRLAVETMQCWSWLQRFSAQTTLRAWKATPHERGFSGQCAALSPKYGIKPDGMSGRWPVLNTLRPLSTTAAILSEEGDKPKSTGSDNTDGADPHAEEQEREHVFTPMRERDMMDRLESHTHQMSLDNVSENCMAATDTTATGDAEQYEGHNSTGGVSLSGVMQTNVPEPFRSTVRGTPTHMNMPGGGTTRADKYLAGHIKDVHPSRQYSTMSSAQIRYEHGKQLSENMYMPYADMQGLHGNIEPSVQEMLHLENPCPQGVQGQDCEHFKVWLNNCVRYGLPDCEDNLKALRLGRKTLPDIFAEQEEMIRLAAQQYRHYSTSVRHFSTSTGRVDSPKDDSVSKGGESEGKLSQKDKLKRAVKEYGGTVVVFHVTISLISLGTAYLAVSSGLDVVGILEKIGVSQEILESRIATGTSTFMVAYAVHKVFAPARIATTLAATPFIVHHLRRIGFLKSPKVN